MCEASKDAQFSRFSGGPNRACSRKFNFSNYSGRKADRVKVSVALSNSFLLGVAMGREIRLQATSYCSRSRFLYSAGTSYVFCRVIKFLKFSVAFFVFGP